MKKRVPILEAGTRVLALDSSSRACGWAVFDEARLAGYGHFVQSGVGHGERLANFRVWLLGMMRDQAPTQVVYEAPYQGRMRNTYGILTRYVGVIEAAHFEHFQAEIAKECAVPAHMVKKAIGAKRGADHDDNKQIVVDLVNKVFGLKLQFKKHDTNKRVSQDDDADAIALNWAYHLLREQAALKAPSQAEESDD